MENKETTQIEAFLEKLKIEVQEQGTLDGQLVYYTTIHQSPREYTIKYCIFPRFYA